MTAQPECGANHPFVDTLVDAHQQAIDALAADRPLDAVVWLSAHLAASQRTVHRAARRAPGAKPSLDAVRSADRDLERLLRHTEQHHSGDSLAAQLSAPRLDADLRRALDAHARAECDLVTELLEGVDGDALTTSYDEAMRHAPTRPHPHVPHGGLLGAAAFRIDALRDRVMDTMDGRTIPSPRPARDIARPGRWGRYVLGEMEQ
jgi:hypothetical protein